MDLTVLNFTMKHRLEEQDEQNLNLNVFQCVLLSAVSLCRQDHFLACAGFFWLTVLPRQMFSYCLTGELCLAGVAKVPRQVERFT